MALCDHVDLYEWRFSQYRDVVTRSRDQVGVFGSRQLSFVILISETHHIPSPALSTDFPYTA